MKILVIQLRRIGDILLTTPVLAYLKQALPGCTVHFLCEPMGTSVLETNPNIDKLFIYDRSSAVRMIRTVRAERYDAVLDFMNNPRTSYLTFLSGARQRIGWRHGFRRVFYNIAVPIPEDPEYVPARKLRLTKRWLELSGKEAPAPHVVRPQLFVGPHDIAIADRWMRDESLTPGDFIIVAPAHRHPIRSWKKEGYRNVALALRKRSGKKIYLAWGPGEEGWMRDVRQGEESNIGMLPLTSMREMAAIFKNAALVLTNDSGVMHTAISVAAPTVTIYGPTRPIDWNPSLAGVGPLDVALNAQELDCLGCHLAKCPIGHMCMEKLGEDRVLAACEKILNEQRREK